MDPRGKTEIKGKTTFQLLGRLPHMVVNCIYLANHLPLTQHSHVSGKVLAPVQDGSTWTKAQGSQTK